MDQIDLARARLPWKPSGMERRDGAEADTYQDRYAATRARVLRLPSLDQEAAGATRAAQFHFLPSFETEAAISVIEFGDMAAVIVCVPERDIYGWGGEVYEHETGQVTHPGYLVSRAVAQLGWEATDLAPIRKVVDQLRSSLKRAP
ncbi:MAG: hypothetical protein H6718_12510 [Polyangiaceae bacterium]|nr:hypothetical protein [Myxococcales bacterium]MCB9586216.1 hypothetical protein [Polyangiaceae bacterium]MCB9606893.1 hypothetical protein [Polyangiaceae bacterium]